MDLYFAKIDKEPKKVNLLNQFCYSTPSNLKIYALLLLWACNFIPANLLSQIDSLTIPSEVEQSLEQYIENIEEEVNFDYNTLLEELSYYSQHPIDLNQKGNDLEALGLLNALQIEQLRQYIYTVGPLISIYELQAVPSFNAATIRRIRPFVSVNKSLDDLNLPLKLMLSKAKKELYIRWSRTLETQKGYEAQEDSPARYEGDANKLYLRYFHAYENNFSIGLTAEKDAGESFFKKTNKQGFDFYSAHFFLKNINATLSRLVIGDFSASFGQGLILNTGYAAGKGAFVTSIKQAGPTLNRFTSVNENLFFRGAGAAINIRDNLQCTFFASYRKLDASIVTPDTLEINRELSNFTSLQFSGFHRTVGELEKRNQLNQLTTGLQIQYKFPAGKIAFNSLYNQFDKNLDRNLQPYNQFLFSGAQLWNNSINYSYFWRNVHLFGETAIDDKGTVASVNGLISNLHPKVSLALHWRHLPANFHSLFGQAFSETTGNNNEQGVYLGLEINPNRQWKLVAYADTWKHPWLRFRADAPSSGQEYFAKLSFTKKRKMEAYVHIKQERKEESYQVANAKQKELLTKVKSNFRLNLNYKVNSALELRSRAEFSFFKLQQPAISDGLIFYDQDWRTHSATKRTGALLFQDILYKPFTFPLSITTRFALFKVDHFDARIYAYENDVLNQFSIPAYYNTGSRFYLNLKYKTRKHLTLEARFAQTYWQNEDSIGSGLNEIEGPKRSDVKVQVKWRF